MRRLLERAFDEAATLPEEDQDLLAGWLLAEVENSRRAATALPGRPAPGPAPVERRPDPGRQYPG